MSLSDELRYQTATGRKYRYPGKKVGYPGVTSVISRAWPAEFLEDWRIGNIAAQCVRDAEAMGKRFKRIAKKPEKYRELHIPALKGMFVEWKQDYTAANRGTRIHSGVERMLTRVDSRMGIEDVYDLYNPDEIASVKMAMMKLEQLGVQTEFVEVPVYNHNPKYAGTADIIGTFRKVIRGKKRRVRAVIDLKTGKRVSKAYIPQLAAYAKATEMLVDGEILPMPRIDVALVLHVRPDSAQFYQVDIAEGWQDFLACSRIYDSAKSDHGMELYG